MNNRAYSVLSIKAVDDEQRIIEGIATTPTTDRMGDVIEPLGVEFTNPMPLLLHHDSQKPVGEAEFKKPSKSGIPFRAKLAKITEPGVLKDRVDEAWQSVKHGLIRGVSIGFRSVEHAFMEESGGIHFLKTKVLELSLVTIPANEQATIQTIKSFDANRPAASGDPPQAFSSPGVSGTPSKPAQSGFFYSRGKQMYKSAAEMRAAREQHVARLGELTSIFKADGYEPSQEETDEFDKLETEVKQLDKDIRIQTHVELSVKHVNGQSTRAGTESRAPMGFVKKTDKDDKFKGQAYTRIIIAKALAQRHGVGEAMMAAQKRWADTNPKLVEYIRATVAGGGTGSGEWGAELAQLDARYTGDFIEYLYGMTVFDQLPLREVPARVRIKGQDGAFTANWVGESKAIPMSKGDYSAVDLDPLKIAALTVISMELMEDSQPSAEMLVRDGLVNAAAQKIDTTFLSTAAASAGVSPAGILNGLSAIQASGTDLAAVRADLQGLIIPFVTAKMSSGIWLLMNPGTALALSFMYGALDERAFPDITQEGGMLNGLRVVVGDNVPPGTIIAIRPQDVWKIGDTGIRVEMSREATIEQRDDPSGETDIPTGVNTTGLTSMFQEESVAFKLVRRINFQKRRTAAVAYLENAEYGGVVS